jgi:hypothetical protein
MARQLVNHFGRMPERHCAMDRRRVGQYRNPGEVAARTGDFRVAGWHSMQSVIRPLGELIPEEYFEQAEGVEFIFPTIEPVREPAIGVSKYFEIWEAPLRSNSFLDRSRVTHRVFSTCAKRSSC